jgi:segregation and condensation protein B
MELESKIEGLLFYKGEDMSIKELAKFLNVSADEVSEALVKLESSLNSRGVVLMKKEDKVTLGIAKELSSLIDSIRKDEITKELSKASLETLSIILYKSSSNDENSGITRHEIDYIRGVNSSFILRNLLVRGLVEKIVDKNDSRRFLYKPTFDTLSYMGVTSIDKLPNYEAVRDQLEEVINEGKESHD